LHIRLHFEVHHVANLKFWLRAVFVSLSFHPLLSTCQLLLQHNCELLSIMKPFAQILYKAGMQVSNTKVTRRVDGRLGPDIPRCRGKSIGGDLNVDNEGSE
jgi:hypothetical protein